MDGSGTSAVRLGWVSAAVLLAVLLMPGQALALAGARDPETGSAITPAERDEILAQHALFRAEVGESPLTWDSAIAAGAQDWADAKQADGRFEHSQGTGLGENLAGGEVRDATMRLAAGEREAYQQDPQVMDGANYRTFGHYTQIVWGATTKVGCGYAPADRLGFGLVVCRYSPPGNFTGQWPYPQGTVPVAQPGLAPVGGPAAGGQQAGTAPDAAPADGPAAVQPGGAPAEQPGGAPPGDPAAEQPGGAAAGGPDQPGDGPAGEPADDGPPADEPGGAPAGEDPDGN